MVTLSLVIVLAACASPEPKPETARPAAASAAPPVARSAVTPAASAAHGHAGHDHHAHGSHGGTDRVPAFYENAAKAGKLPPTLPPEQFFGKAREAYRAVREIPQTIAQLPCYCYCDESFGHKSLHSCFEDNHGSQCAVCVEEVLAAYRLQKEGRLSPAEIRRVIIEKFGPRS